MKFPKQELDIDTYLQKIETLLKDDSCHIFIDTNIISQLYRLNEDARNNFYNWIESCKDRFHIPCWSVLEYSKRVTSNKTRDYLSELTEAKSISKQLDRITQFVKAYVGDSLLIGTLYAGKKDKLFSDIDEATKKIEKVAYSINKNLTQHQLNVHKEVLDKLQQFTIESDVYEILRNIETECELRFNNEVAPGYKDSDKSSNRFGDMIIWKEIIDYCKGLGDDLKAIFITRDRKIDMVYRPIKQTRQGNPIVHDDDKITIAQESLVYEFKRTTNSEDFYLIDFYTLVKILSSNYRELATSFQIATQNENMTSIGDIDNTEHSECSDTKYLNDFFDKEIDIPDQQRVIMPEVETTTIAKMEYSESALADSNYDTSKGLSSVNECIKKLKTYNWYVQNPAINELTKLSFKDVSKTQENIDAFFVLGRNILQGADGTSGSAIIFIEKAASRVLNWPAELKKAFVDGCLYEVFFDSMGKIRQKSFKASYFETFVEQVGNMKIDNPFIFINEELKQKNGGRFVPEVGSSKKYSFEFSFGEVNENDVFDFPKTKSLKINGIDVSETFKNQHEIKFSDAEGLKISLSEYYAIPVQNIEIGSFPSNVSVVNYICEKDVINSLPF